MRSVFSRFAALSMCLAYATTVDYAHAARTATPSPSPAPTASIAAPKHHGAPASYINYRVHVSRDDTHGAFDYGIRAGSGVAQISALAAAGAGGRAFTLTGLGWQRGSESSGNLLIIGDAQSHRGKYEEFVRFDGVQYSSPAFAYDLGWERTDFGDGAMQLGRFMTQATVNRRISRQFTAEAHLFTDPAGAIAGLGAQWFTPRAGQLRFGIAPGSHGLTGYFSYAFTSQRFTLNLDDRVWGAQAYEPGAVVPSNYRDVHAMLRYSTSFATRLEARYSEHVQGALPVRNASVGYVRVIDGTELHLDFTSSRSAFARSAGLTTYLSVPLAVGHSITQESTLAGGLAAKTVTLKQDLPDSGIGTGYALKFGQDGAGFTDAVVTAQTSGSSTAIELSHFGGTAAWNADISGSRMFIDGRGLSVNQTIDQSNAFNILKGRSSVTLTLVSDTGRPLPAGSVVRAVGENGAWRLQSDGRVDIDDISTGPQTLIVSLQSGSCIAGITVPPNLSAQPDLGKLMCRHT